VAAGEGLERRPQAPPATADELPLLLTGVRVVLVSPKTPGNIGAVLRVAENFEVGCSRGCLSARLPACPPAFLPVWRAMVALLQLCPSATEFAAE
jgi:hypothetical protein